MSFDYARGQLGRRSASRGSRVDLLGLVGVGVGLLGLSAALLPIELPESIAIIGWAVGGACVLTAGLLHVRHAVSSRRASRSRTTPQVRAQDSMLALATDCRRLRYGIDELLKITAVPRGMAFTPRSRAENDAARDREVVRRYGAEFRQPAIATLTEASMWCTVSAASRGFAQGQSATHIRLLVDVFADLEQRLVRSAEHAA